MSAAPELVLDPLAGRQLVGDGRQAGGNQRDDRDVARVDAGGRRGVDRLGGDPLDLGGAAGAVGDEAAAAVPVATSPSASSFA